MFGVISASATKFQFIRNTYSEERYRIGERKSCSDPVGSSSIRRSAFTSCAAQSCIFIFHPPEYVHTPMAASAARSLPDPASELPNLLRFNTLRGSRDSEQQVELIAFNPRQMSMCATQLPFAQKHIEEVLHTNAFKSNYVLSIF